MEKLIECCDLLKKDLEKDVLDKKLFLNFIENNQDQFEHIECKIMSNNNFIDDYYEISKENLREKILILFENIDILSDSKNKKTKYWSNLYLENDYYEISKENLREKILTLFKNIDILSDSKNKRTEYWSKSYLENLENDYYEISKENLREKILLSFKNISIVSKEENKKKYWTKLYLEDLENDYYEIPKEDFKNKILNLTKNMDTASKKENKKIKCLFKEKEELPKYIVKKLEGDYYEISKENLKNKVLNLSKEINIVSKKENKRIKNKYFYKKSEEESKAVIENLESDYYKEVSKNILKEKILGKYDQINSKEHKNENCLYCKEKLSLLK